MTPQEIKFAREIFTVLPTITIAVCLAMMYVRLRIAAKKKKDKEDALENRVSANENNIRIIAKTHLVRHPEDATKFIKKEFVEK